MRLQELLEKQETNPEVLRHETRQLLDPGTARLQSQLRLTAATKAFKMAGAGVLSPV